MNKQEKHGVIIFILSFGLIVALLLITMTSLVIGVGGWTEFFLKFTQKGPQ